MSHVHYNELLDFWFGRVEETIVPSKRRAQIWFGDDPALDIEIQQRFASTYHAAAAGQLDEWLDEPRGRLAMIVLFDQIARHLFQYGAEAFAQDSRAIEICLEGAERGAEHALSLIERVFYFFPLLHSEDMTCQTRSLSEYQLLSDLALSETQVVFDSFLKFATHHYALIQRFGRFPQRNACFERQSTPDELAYLNELRQQESGDDE